MDLDRLRKLAGVDKGAESPISGATGAEKAELMRKHSIKPGTPEWFKLWFSKPYLTGEKPI